MTQDSTTDRVMMLVEDNEDDVFLMKRALKAAGVMNPLVVADNGQVAIDYLSGTGEFGDRDRHPLPALIFLDLKLPLKSGHDVLAWIRRRKELDAVIVVVLTSSNERTDLNRCYQLGANSYVVKPPTAEQLLDLAKSFKWYWLRYNRFVEY